MYAAGGGEGQGQPGRGYPGGDGQARTATASKASPADHVTDVDYEEVDGNK